jgi:hypothetical protein
MEAGVDFDVETRARALTSLLNEYEVGYDQDEVMPNAAVEGRCITQNGDAVCRTPFAY